jgi:glycosyltransferase involved in cell wall biosynthesis
MSYEVRYNPIDLEENVAVGIKLPLVGKTGILFDLSSMGHKFVCLLVGTGMSSNNEILMKLVNKFSVQDAVKLIGPRFDIPKVMASLDVHILSSGAESFPNVLAEAMACGTPCITTDVGDAALIVGGTGWVVPHSDPSALAHAIQKVFKEMKDSSEWNVRKEACRMRITENYSIERMITSYSRIWIDSYYENK